MPWAEEPESRLSHAVRGDVSGGIDVNPVDRPESLAILREDWAPSEGEARLKFR